MENPPNPEPAEPGGRHVWVRPAAGHGRPSAGVVVAWQRAPLHQVHTSAWMALVATAPHADLLLIGWVGAERLISLRDPRPAGARPVEATPG